jgi:hypothetical protein
MKIKKVLFILLCSFVSLSAMQRNASRFLLGIPLQHQSIREMVAPRAQTPTPQNTVLDLNEWKTVTQVIVNKGSTNELFRELNGFFNDPSIIQIAMSNDRTKIILYKDNEPEDPIEQAFDISPADLQLFTETQDAVRNHHVLAPADDDQQDSQAQASTLPAPAPVRINAPVALPSSTPTTVTNTPAAIPPVSSVSTPAAQQQMIPAENPVKKTKEENEVEEKSKDKYLPYGYNPYDQNQKDSPSGEQPSYDQSQYGGGRSSSQGRNSGNDPYGGYNDPYYGMNGDYYGNPMSVHGGGGGINAGRSSGGVGSSLSSQVGFAVTKPPTTQPQYATHADVKKLSSQGQSTIVVPQSSTVDIPDIEYQRTIQLEPETLYHTRKTEPTQRLRIAPVKEEPVTSSNETPEKVLPIKEKKPVSFFNTLWDTITQPFVASVHWFLSFVYRK